MPNREVYTPIPTQNNEVQRVNFEESYRLHNRWAKDIEYLLEKIAGLTPKQILTWIQLSAKQIKRITDSDSPYTIQNSDSVLFCDTDGGAITANLPVGYKGRYLRLTNVGSGGNDVTVSPNGADLLFGVNANYLLTDGETIDIVYESTEGWW